ncbi:hypothetical protein CEXT_387881 [Caerostris extrusa]|uniref:Uncharacterized protein n=1 Tax=Caerostris extrusa TaxID=172846 RepID=A0AAV4XBF5_CAEEX|nr:hypothetical protein CEXT_387881 [Caerostris extrusa]
MHWVVPVLRLYFSADIDLERLIERRISLLFPKTFMLDSSEVWSTSSANWYRSSGELVRYCDFIISSKVERGVLSGFEYLKRIKDDYGGRQTLVGEGELHHFLSVMFLMDWLELNVFDVTGVVLLIGFVGKKLKDSGYD